MRSTNDDAQREERISGLGWGMYYLHVPTTHDPYASCWSNSQRRRAVVTMIRKKELRMRPCRATRTLERLACCGTIGRVIWRLGCKSASELGVVRMYSPL